MMNRILFQTTHQLQDWIIGNAGHGDLVLTPGGRMARQILHRSREHKLASGDRGWFPPGILSLNTWFEDIWKGLWPECIPASHWNRLLIWLKAIRQAPPPETFMEGLPLAEHLDSTYAILIRHLISPTTRAGTEPLVRWSTEVMTIFQTLMHEDGLIHPVEMPAYISRILCGETGEGKGDYRGILPKRVIAARLEQASPLEKVFLERLEHVTRLEWLETAAPSVPSMDAFLLPDMQQEAEWIVERAMEASHHYPLHRIGIAVTDMKAYGALFERLLVDLLGQPAGDGDSSFNITLGKPLIRSSLVQAAMLPIRVAMEDRNRPHLFSLLQSPYYAIWAPVRHRLAMLDRTWRRENLEGDLDHLLECTRREYPEETKLLENLKAMLAPLLNPGAAMTMKGWHNLLSGIWEGCSFPVLAGEEDQVSWKHLLEGMGIMERDLGTERIGLGECLQWLSAFCTREIFSRRGYEHAGLQIMGLIEARGLSFDLLFIPGMVSGLFPEPARHLPFLSAQERRMVQGGTAEDQYRFAEVLFRKLSATANTLILSRPEQRANEPLVQSPFWPQKDQRDSVDPWNSQSPVWARCGWLYQARRGIMEGGAGAIPGTEQCSEPIPLPESISSTALESGIACPFRFFVHTSLQINSLSETDQGLQHRARGEMLHRFLARFVDMVRAQGLDLVRDLDAVKKLMRQEALKLLTPLARHFPWQVELQRWLGEDESRGLLLRWLEEERMAWEKGMRWLSAEVSFADLTVGGHGIRISGRIDRVDLHPAGGYVCWDYKTGKAPSRKDVEDLRAPQLLPYIQAIRKGHTPIPVSPSLPVAGGYILLQSSVDIRHFDCSLSSQEWESLVTAWEGAVSDLLDSLKQGDVRPSPMPAPTRKDKGACEHCPVVVLCAYEFQDRGDRQG